MAERTFRMPDIGEGIAEAEISEWMVEVGDIIREDDVICAVTTDKATVEIPAAVGGKVTWRAGEAGESLAVGSDLVRIDTGEAGEESAEEKPATERREAPKNEEAGKEAPEPSAKEPEPAPQTDRPRARKPAAAPARNVAGRPLAAPSVRGRARELGIDLRQLRGTGPAGRITHEDLDDFARHGPEAGARSGPARRHGSEEERVTGVRRKIAERMAQAKAEIPHISIIEEVEVQALEELRAELNRRFAERRGRLTLLPFLLTALARALVEHPQVNAHYDADAGVITRHAPLHCGIATQTDAGLMVPVLQHAEALDLWELAREIARLSEAARDRRMTPEELRGSTLTVTSLGPLGALATTPIINLPEVAIIGVNRIAIRPVWDGSGFVPRRMMNLSCSFDHRVIDGWVAARFVAGLKALLEVPAMLFMEARDD
ncbi:dihydrolipoamide acetyltransferase family protein [Sulfitobacter aestuarii]|uniref:Dihydrolipoamide acetyltransferase component of pyruvate dehydrogenase complex n=1 Tax=Sulfitobacter aestuarii TaxID=2161676 RepID=A0ABW5U142_9RHOB